MLSASEVRNVRFTSAVAGYKKEEVDLFLDKIESDYELFERTLQETNKKIEELKAELEDNKNAHGNIHNVLISAQKFADQIVEEAKQKSAEIVAAAEASIEKITAQEKELTTNFDKKATERKAALQSDIDAIIATAQKKQEAVENATQNCVERQQLLFNKMKLEIAAFKAEITAKYKEHLEMLTSIPDAVPSDPQEIAAAIALSFDSVPTVEEYVKNPESLKIEKETEEIVEEVAETEEIIENDESEADDDALSIAELVKSTDDNVSAKPVQPTSTGFVINIDEFDTDD